MVMGKHRPGRSSGSDAPPQTLRVDWPSCVARGLCHETLPELVSLDEWGYPVVSGPVPEWLQAEARLAVSACPHSALRLVAGR